MSLKQKAMGHNNIPTFYQKLVDMLSLTWFSKVLETLIYVYQKAVFSKVYDHSYEPIYDFKTKISSAHTMLDVLKKLMIILMNIFTQE